MPILKQKLAVQRYFRKGEFNPRSKDQLLAYMEGQGLQGGAATEKSGKPTLDKKVLESLALKDPLFKKILDLKAIQKVESTYADNAIEQLRKGPRLHYNFFHKPSTMRLSSGKPFNIQNVVADKEKESEAAGFRRCVVAAPGHVLLEADKAAVEAVVTGWCAKAPNYIRLATLGVHDFLTSHLVQKPADLGLDNAKLGAYLKWIKENYPTERELAKKVVHGSNYGLSPWGMAKRYPEMFTVRTATDLQELYFRICPEIRQFQSDMRNTAHKQGYVGGSWHPFRYKHWFWDVMGWNPEKSKVLRGADFDRVVAYPGQSISAGLQYEDALKVMEEPWFAEVKPIRALIHDSILCEVPDAKVEHAKRVLQRVMTRPVQELPCPQEWNLGTHLSIGVSIKVGRNWANWSEQNQEGMKTVELGSLGTAEDTALYEESDAA